MRLAMIGPSYPFKGGIASYTTQFYRELARNHDVLFCSFKRQYPDFLYPGKTDRDASNTSLRDEGIVQSIDSLNPISWWSTLKKLGDFKPDILVIPWWVMFWAPLFIYIIRGIKSRSSHTRIIFVCHNVVAHEPGRLSGLLTRLTLKLGDGFLVHSARDRQDLESMIGRVKVVQAELPVDDVREFGGGDRKKACQKLRITGNCLLFFGFVRPYKGLGVLLDAMPEILEKMPCQLIVAGEIWGDASSYSRQIEQLGIEDHVSLVGNYIEEPDVADYFLASDLVVLPYLSATGSGVVKLAYSHSRPVLVTNVGSLPAAVFPGKTGHIVEPGDKSALAKAVIEHFSVENSAVFSEAVGAYRQEFGWRQLIEHFETLVAYTLSIGIESPESS